jgi:putative transposase
MGRTRQTGDGEFDAEALYEQIGRLKMELEWVKRKLVYSAEDRRSWIEPEDRAISVRRQCVLLGVSRASLYYEPVEQRQENLRLMQALCSSMPSSVGTAIRRNQKNLISWTRMPASAKRWLPGCLSPFRR